MASVARSISPVRVRLPAPAETIDTHPHPVYHPSLGMFRIILGIVFIIGGLSGQLVLVGTHSGPALAVVGGIMVVLGVVQFSRR